MFRPILVFDSGVGGLSVLSEIRSLLPGRDYVYLFDNARLPYGELADQVLISGCVDLIVRLSNQLDAALVVVACNTASTLVLPELRRQLDIPVVGVVPAIKPAAALSKACEIGLLATPGTIKRDYTHRLIGEFAKDTQVHLFSSSELVILAERKMAGVPIPEAELVKILEPIKQTGLDVLVLGCTHFPMLKAEMCAALGDNVSLLDSGKAVARRVMSLLPDSVQQSAKMGTLCGFYTTVSLDTGLKRTLMLLGFSELTHFPPQKKSIEVG
ncbi:MAG: glutamate racemase [Shewanella sp.]|nr:glutamate racemase [Shewanella sp.]MCF1430536.1 glutamate racemase [Shewanella sp.]MCF1439082.1 glutamate racemase [Shewanella sp.]MCF1459140.1 glutamate racemase [Shewanella sp.]